MRSLQFIVLFQQLFFLILRLDAEDIRVCDIHSDDISRERKSEAKQDCKGKRTRSRHRAILHISMNLKSVAG